MQSSFVNGKNTRFTRTGRPDVTGMFGKATQPFTKHYITKKTVSDIYIDIVCIIVELSNKFDEY